MKEMFYSEVLNKYFDNKRECREAEIQYYVDQKRAKQEELDAKRKAEEEAKAKEEAAAKEEEQRKEALNLISKEKKELSKAIEDAGAKVIEAENEYELAYTAFQKKVVEAKEAYDKAIAEARESTIIPASTKVNDAKKEKYEAVKAFNNKFGTYTVKYTGEQAYKEMQQTINEFNKIFNSIWF